MGCVEDAMAGGKKNRGLVDERAQNRLESTGMCLGIRRKSIRVKHRLIHEHYTMWSWRRGSCGRSRARGVSSLLQSNRARPEDSHRRKPQCNDVKNNTRSSANEKNNLEQQPTPPTSTPYSVPKWVYDSSISEQMPKHFCER